MRLAPDAREALRKSTAAALAKAKGNQGTAAAALGVNRRTVQKRLAALFSTEERAAMAERYGWVGVKAKEKSK